MRAFVSRTKGFFHSLASVRPAWSTPFVSTIKMCSSFTPRRTQKLVQAMAEAPAPETTTRTWSSFLPASSTALSSAAPEMMAVPC